MSYNTQSANQQNTQVLLAMPKPQQQQKVENIYVINEERKCMKNCCPVLSTGCDISSTCCGNFYLGGICNSVGFTGLLVKNTCIVYDENWGGCGECIGCKKDCPQVGPCPYTAGGWFDNAGGAGGAPFYGNWPH